MKNSNESGNTERINSIIDELKRAQKSDMIADRMSAAIASFPIPFSAVNTFAKFNDILAFFIQHLHGHCNESAWTPTRAEALSEAIELLEHDYESQGARGYEAAYLEAVSNDGHGIEEVLAQLGEIIMQREIRRQQEWAFASIVDPSDWALHKEIAAQLLERLGLFLQPNGKPNPAQFAEQYRELIALVL